MHRSLLVLVAILTLGAATVAFAGPGKDRDRRDHHGKRHHRVAMATLIDADRERVGRVWFKERRRDGGVLVFARVRDLPPGFHGFHIHTTGRCDPPTFMSAGGHYNPTGAT